MIETLLARDNHHPEGVKANELRQILAYIDQLDATVERQRKIIEHAYLGALVLRTICKKKGWTLALESTDKLISDMTVAMPELPCCAALRPSRPEEKP